MALPWHFHGIAMAMPWHCHDIATALPWHCYGNALALPSISMELQWPYMSYPIWSCLSYELELDVEEDEELLDDSLLSALPGKLAATAMAAAAAGASAKASSSASVLIEPGSGL
jgi:hypothetical protein